MNKAYTAKDAAQQACVIAYSDSHVQMDVAKVEEAIVKDFEVSARLPLSIELEELIMGDDEGEPQHTDTFPNLHKLLTSYFE
jgi:hypothetical protein